MKKTSFEDNLSSLEKIVSLLDEGNISISEAMKLFEKGVKLSRLCNSILDETERKVEILLKDGKGGLNCEPFPDPDLKNKDEKGE